MVNTTRLVFLFFGLLHVIGAVHVSHRYGEWSAAGGPIAGPDAVPFNAALLAFSAVGYILAYLWEGTFEKGTCWRIAPFLGAHAVVCANGAAEWFLFAVVASFFGLSVWERRRELSACRLAMADHGVQRSSRERPSPPGEGRWY